MMKIAICEDNKMENLVLSELVSDLANERELDILLDNFNSGEELLERLKEYRYDVIFLDILMKKIDGIETAKMIRKSDTSVDIIYCTASPDFAIEAYQVHAKSYLLKPYNPKELGEILDDYVYEP